jgi:hypothetical protein
MIKSAPIVDDTRGVRRLISEKFQNDPDKYIDHLISQEMKAKRRTGSEMNKKRDKDEPEPAP